MRSTSGLLPSGPLKALRSVWAKVARRRIVSVLDAIKSSRYCAMICDDGIFTSIYANPNGEDTKSSSGLNLTHAAIVRDIIDRSARFGIKVYTQIIYDYQGTRESELGLRKLVRNILRDCPEIQGYVLLTEGFEYNGNSFGRLWGGANKDYLKPWTHNWAKAIEVVEEECHRVNPNIEILPWEYNIDFRPNMAETKAFVTSQLPDKTIPLITWENGKSFKLDDVTAYTRDYTINVVGPAEVTEAMIFETKKRGMKFYSKADTFASWQYGSQPYLPCVNQWYDRYMALEEWGVKGTLESWSSGYKPNFITELRAWTCWTDGPSKEELFSATASQLFGKDQKDLVIKAWDHFSQSIRLVPDTGPNMGTVGAIGSPIFFQEPPLRVGTRDHGFTGGSRRPTGDDSYNYWPFTVPRLVFFPDFTNQINRAEQYARGATAVKVEKETKFLPLFLKYLQLAVDQMEEGLKLYREAAYKSPESKRQQSVKEVVVAEQMQRMMQSDIAILEFEDLRLQWVNEQDSKKAGAIMDRMESIARDELARTKLSLIAASRDSRLGYQWEQDYVYTPYSLKEKIGVLEETLNKQLPEARRRKSV